MISDAPSGPLQTIVAALVEGRDAAPGAAAVIASEPRPGSPPRAGARRRRGTGRVVLAAAPRPAPP